MKRDRKQKKLPEGRGQEEIASEDSNFKKSQYIGPIDEREAVRSAEEKTREEVRNNYIKEEI